MNSFGNIGHPQTPVTAPRGTDLTCKGWPQEAAYRMLQNNLDAEVAENPDELVVYGGTGRAARSWPAYSSMLRTLTTLAADETMLVQSGKPVGVLRTHEWAPRVLIANSNLVPDWADWDEFRRLEHQGLTMYGQMTAGSWIYIGTQGILQGTYECFAEIARRRFDGSLRGTLTLTAGAGGMGGAQPLAVTMNGGAVLIIDVDQHMLERRVAHRYLDEIAPDYGTAIARVTAARAAGEAVSVGLLGNAADLVPRLLADGLPADIVTDQTSAHDPLSYVPNDLTLEAADELRRSDPTEFTRRARAAMATHCRGHGRVSGRRGRSVRLRQQPSGRSGTGRLRTGFCLPRIPSGLHPATVLRGHAVRSGGLPCPVTRPTSPPPIRRCSRSFPTTNRWPDGSRLAGERVAFQGLPARICWLGYGERHRLGLRFNEMVQNR